ncbi:MAG: DUF420 domain-containing protein [Gemmatimonadota bacterium]|nr:DUF420 domain-containing protein [Gemmatimonadota bacterium]MDE2984028.1 DUF420 domain-containing protein [Gemmatimonadota bacterium]
MTAETAGQALAAVNAALNLTCTVLLLAGFRLIRRGEVRKHRRCMVGAVTASALFLVLYLVRFSLTGTHTFEGPATVRRIYLVILFSHMVLAAAVVPLVLRLLHLLRHRRFKAHGRLARWTLPVWLYVSVTGLFVYYMLYHAYG